MRMAVRYHLNSYTPLNNNKEMRINKNVELNSNHIVLVLFVLIKVYLKRINSLVHFDFWGAPKE